MDKEGRCRCGGQYKTVSADEAIGPGGALDTMATPPLGPERAIAEALAQLNIAETARRAGDEGSARSAVAKAIRILRVAVVSQAKAADLSRVCAVDDGRALAKLVCPGCGVYKLWLATEDEACWIEHSLIVRRCANCGWRGEILVRTDA